MECAGPQSGAFSIQNKKGQLAFNDFFTSYDNLEWYEEDEVHTIPVLLVLLSSDKKSPPQGIPRMEKSPGRQVLLPFDEVLWVVLWWWILKVYH